MRIISGSMKGRNLLNPKSKNSRPTDNKVKEAIFDILFEIKKDSVCLDLFACTGQIGIEFLSRGARKAYFCEINADNYNRLNKNLKYFENDSYVTYKNDFRKALDLIEDKFDYIFLDPPYSEDFISQSVSIILKNNQIKDDGLIITESDRDIKLCNELLLIKQKKYGRKILKFYKKK